MIECIYGNCAAGCNKEPVQAVVAQVIVRYSGFANVVGNYGNAVGSVGCGARCRTRVSNIQSMYSKENSHDCMRNM